MGIPFFANERTAPGQSINLVSSAFSEYLISIGKMPLPLLYKSSYRVSLSLSEPTLGLIKVYSIRSPTVFLKSFSFSSSEFLKDLNSEGSSPSRYILILIRLSNFLTRFKKVSVPGDREYLLSSVIS